MATTTPNGSSSGDILLQSGAFRLQVAPSTGNVVSIQRAGDPLGANFIRAGGDGTLGEVTVACRSGGGPWREAGTAASGDIRKVRFDTPDAPTQVEISYAGNSADPHGLRDLELIERFALEGDALAWTLELRNVSGRELEIGDLAISLPMNNAFTRDREQTFTARVFRHAFISGHGSFLFWLPVGGVGPHLVMTPMPTTRLEYFTDRGGDYAWGKGDYRVFVHSAASNAAENQGSWRQKPTSLTLPPRAAERTGPGNPGPAGITYGFRFRWADDYAGVREILYQERLCDVHVAPGMVVPEGLPAWFSLRTRERIESVVPEHPGQTALERLADRGKDVYVYRARFARLGENLLTVNLAGGRSMVLEFFVCQPLETLIRKRAAFIAANQQHRDPGAWYDGLFSLWDVRMPPGKNLLGPDNLGGQHPYAVSGSDDPSNCKCLYLAEKNVAYPDAGEVAALEYFIEHFVWGKHQRTDKETPHPYGIYGCDSWRQCRDSQTGLNSGGHGQERMWRTFDYTTYFALYYNMYRIARLDARLAKYLDAKGYLERAFGTARAYFEVPYSINMQGWDFNGWCDWAYTLGNFHEKYLLGIMAALEREGEKDKAAWLRAEWEKKVRYFLSDAPYPWTSEMPVDSTAYESTYVAGLYAVRNKLGPAQRLWQDKNSLAWHSYPAIGRPRGMEFLARQLLANLACRGCLEPAYYHLGSDFRGCGSGSYTLSYMSQMGGWAVLDQAIRFVGPAGESPAPGAATALPPSAELIRLGYASMLSSWALVNAGTSETHYGYWYPGPIHDGAAAWGFMPQKTGREWNPACQPIPRGPWPVDGEIDHGLAAYVEGACTVVVNDPLFGLIAYGGDLAVTDGRFEVTPKDGVRRAIHLLICTPPLRLTLDSDGFAAGSPVAVSPSLDDLRFLLENRTGGTHRVTLTVEGLPAGLYAVAVDHANPIPVTVLPNQPAQFILPIGPGPLHEVRIER